MVYDRLFRRIAMHIPRYLLDFNEHLRAHRIEATAAFAIDTGRAALTWQGSLADLACADVLPSGWRPAAAEGRLPVRVLAARSSGDCRISICGNVFQASVLIDLPREIRLCGAIEMLVDRDGRVEYHADREALLEAGLCIPEHFPDERHLKSRGWSHFESYRGRGWRTERTPDNKYLHAVETDSEMLRRMRRHAEWIAETDPLSLNRAENDVIIAEAGVRARTDPAFLQFMTRAQAPVRE
jgi:hypothetical protein